MCHFLTCTLPPDADLDAVQRPFAGLVCFDALPAPAWADGDLYLRLTGGPCDCDTPIGSRARRARRPRATPARLRKLRRKGWSEARIAKYLEGLPATPDPDVDPWVAFLTHAARTAGRLGLLLHWYRGALEDGPRRVGVQRAAAAEHTRDHLLDLPEDVLLVVAGQQGA